MKTIIALALFFSLTGFKNSTFENSFLNTQHQLVGSSQRTEAVLWDMKVLPDSSVLILTSNTVFKFSSEGKPDKTFGNEGKVSLPSHLQSGAFSLAVGKDQSIFVIGWKFLIKFLPDGTLDLNFANNGRLTLLAPEYMGAPACNADKNGNIFVTTIGQSGPGKILELHAFLVQPDGRFVATFGNQGHARTPIPPILDQIENRVVGDKMLVIGSGRDATGYKKGFVISFAPDGSLDKSFDGDGVISIAESEVVSISGIARSPDGGYLVNGPYRDNLLTYRKYKADGTFDPMFGEGGRVSYITGNITKPSDVISRGGDFYAGYLRFPDAGAPYATFEILKADAKTGRRDKSFGTAGRIQIVNAEYNAYQGRLASDTAGRLYAGIRLNKGSNLLAFVGRFLPDGSVDTSFGDGGNIALDTDQ